MGAGTRLALGARGASSSRTRPDAGGSFERCTRWARPRRPGRHRLVDVAVGVLIDARGRFLLTSRPEGKVYAGYWEFQAASWRRASRWRSAAPRAARRNSASPSAAAVPWRIELVDYPHARVKLNFCKVFAWSGDFEMRERQSMSWQTLPVVEQPVLPGTVPVLQWFAEERGFTGATHAG